MRHCRPEDTGSQPCPFSRVITPGAAGEGGSAVVEFTFLGLLLLVPVVYLVLTVGALQGGSFAVVGAADQAAKVYANAASQEAADQQARQAVLLALSDFGFSGEQVRIDIACEGTCLAPASSVTVVVELEVPLPLIPTMPGINTSAATLTSTSTQIVERYG
ncbi:hypothetical protein [Arthrobacter sp. Br18]|uniref:hypothetical protein n=1 Tax=Arthrobacter sp. Br18 TaxID=1312954 RepID=UPI0004B24F28|nr:hypothetical protein [Arthrobacter sp. Br18]